MVRSDDIELSVCTAAGIEKLVTWAKWPECKEFYRHFPPRLEWTRSQVFLETLLMNSLEIKKQSDVVGVAYFYNTNPVAKSVSVALIVPHAEHKTITDEVYKQIQSYVFVEKDFNRIECTIMSHRQGLQSRLEALGFRPEGLLRQSCRLDDQPHDEILLGLVKSDRK